MKQRIGFLGLGQMGRPMVRNLLRAGFEVTGFDPAPQAAESLQGESGFHTATSAVQAAQGVDVLILMLPSSQVIDDLLWNQGLTTHMKAGQLILDMSSSDPVCSRDNAAKLSALGIQFVDAPVSGGVKRAVDGSLAIMMGGS